MTRIQRLLVAIFTFGALLTFTPALAHAQDAGDQPVVVEDVGAHFVLSPIHWTIITGLVIPVVIAALTKINASSRVRAVLAVLADVIGTIVIRATKVDGSAVFDQAILLDFLFLFVPTVASYVGFWQPVAKVNEKIAPRFGIGPAQ